MRPTSGWYLAFRMTRRSGTIVLLRNQIRAEDSRPPIQPRLCFDDSIRREIGSLKRSRWLRQHGFVFLSDFNQFSSLESLRDSSCSRVSIVVRIELTSKGKNRLTLLDFHDFRAIPERCQHWTLSACAKWWLIHYFGWIENAAKASENCFNPFSAV